MYFMGKPTMANRPTLILECTCSKCAMWGKDYQHIGEYMWLMLEDGVLSKAEARHEYEAALRFQRESLA